MFILPLVPDVSGKRVPVPRRPYSGRTWARGGFHRPLSLCAASDVCRHGRFCGGHLTIARIWVRSPFRAAFCGRASAAGGAGGTHAAGETARLCDIYDTGEISAYPVCLVIVKSVLS